jgi:uncharacterized protein YlxP (DUF503 family)
MIVGTARIVLHIPGSLSLKDKRQVMKSVLAQVQREFGVAAAEIERQDQWQIGVLGLAYVSTSAAHADEVIAKAVDFIEARGRDAELLDYQTEVLHAL